jgi:pyrophosphatase PpaX
MSCSIRPVYAASAVFAVAGMAACRGAHAADWFVPFDQIAAMIPTPASSAAAPPITGSFDRTVTLCHPATIGRVRFPVVLFDLDGTVVDSGGIILASMRHATRTVLGRKISDEALMAAVGGSGLESQMRAFGGEQHMEELIRVYRAHNEPLHEELQGFVGVDDVLVALKEQGRKLGIVSAKRTRTVELAFASVEIGHLFDVVVGGDMAAGQKPAPDLLLLALDRLNADPKDAAYVGDSPFDMQAARAAGMVAIGVTWGGIHGRQALGDADVIVDTAEELLVAL